MVEWSFESHSGSWLSGLLDVKVRNHRRPRDPDRQLWGRRRSIVAFDNSRCFYHCSQTTIVSSYSACSERKERKRKESEGKNPGKRRHRSPRPSYFLRLSVGFGGFPLPLVALWNSWTRGTIQYVPCHHRGRVWLDLRKRKPAAFAFFPGCLHGASRGLNCPQYLQRRDGRVV